MPASTSRGFTTTSAPKRLFLKSFLRCQQASCEPFYAVEMCDFRLKRMVPQRSCLPKMLVFLGKLLLRNSLLEGLAPAMVQELSELETLNDNVLRLVMLET